MHRRNAARTTAAAGLVAGSLDGLAAIINYLAVGRKDPLVIFHYIAGGVFGQSAISGNDVMVVCGEVFHCAIATTWAALFFLVVPLSNVVNAA